MNIKTKLKLKCTHCGGAKYIDDPYYESAQWYVDIACIRCGHSKTIEAEEFKRILRKIEGS